MQNSHNLSNKPPYETRLGRYVSTVAFDETVNAYVPPPLPPIPPLTLSDSLLHDLSEADRAIGRLDGVAMLLPNKALFLYMYIRKEAVLSSQIEGTQSTLDDLLRFENSALSGQPIDDITEVSNYVDAMMFGLNSIRDSQGLPLSLRLLRNMHTRLLQKGRGADKNPGNSDAPRTGLAGPDPGMPYSYRPRSTKCTGA